MTIFEINGKHFIVKTKDSKKNIKETAERPGGDYTYTYGKSKQHSEVEKGSTTSISCESPRPFNGCKFRSPSGQVFNIGIGGGSRYYNARIDCLCTEEEYDPTLVCGILIKDLKNEDTGEWTCQLEFKRNGKTVTKSNTKYLEVLNGLSTYPKIEEKTCTDETGAIYNEGDSWTCADGCNHCWCSNGYIASSRKGCITVLNGGWSTWGSWSFCNSQTGKKTRTRQCDNPAPLHGGATCSGSSNEQASCPVNGGWSAWGSWSSCNSQTGKKTRTRQCNNPSPQHGGATCSGSSNDQAPCPVEPENKIPSCHNRKGPGSRSIRECLYKNEGAPCLKECCNRYPSGQCCKRSRDTSKCKFDHVSGCKKCKFPK